MSNPDDHKEQERDFFDVNEGLHRADYTQKCLKWETIVVNLWHENFRRRS